MRGQFYANYGGADFGEITSTVGRMGESTSPDDWQVATADRIATIGHKSAAAGYPVSARDVPDGLHLLP